MLRGALGDAEVIVQDRNFSAFDTPAFVQATGRWAAFEYGLPRVSMYGLQVLAT